MVVTNIGYACTKLPSERLGLDAPALRWVALTGDIIDVTYNELDFATDNVATGLARHRLPDGSVVAVCMPKCPEFFAFALGALKAGFVVCPLFQSLGSDALFDRLADSRAAVFVGTNRQSKRAEALKTELPHLRHVIDMEGVRALAAGAEAGGLKSDCLMEELPGEWPAMLHYTSGSTGKPKGVLHTHSFLGHIKRTAEDVLGLKPGIGFWCTAEAGWVTGSSYGLLAPLALGAVNIIYSGGYDAESWMKMLANNGVEVWYTAPTAIRMLKREDAATHLVGLPKPCLRSVFSVGEPLDPESIAWGKASFGVDIHDTWFQTETGAIMIANTPGEPLKPGSMGKPVCGVEACIIAEDGTPSPVSTPGCLALRAGWPSMFTAYLGRPDDYDARFVGPWYMTGDIAKCDEDGYFWFLGRSDDIINTAGHLVGPFDVEKALLELPEVAEAAAVGVPDDILFEKVAVFVVMTRGVALTAELMLKLRLHVSNRVSSVANPQVIIEVDELPKNNSGKILRRILKADYIEGKTGHTSASNEDGLHP